MTRLFPDLTTVSGSARNRGDKVIDALEHIGASGKISAREKTYVEEVLQKFVPDSSTLSQDNLDYLTLFFTLSGAVSGPELQANPESCMESLSEGDTELELCRLLYKAAERAGFITEETLAYNRFERFCKQVRDQGFEFNEGASKPPKRLIMDRPRSDKTDTIVLQLPRSKAVSMSETNIGIKVDGNLLGEVSFGQYVSGAPEAKSLSDLVGSLSGRGEGLNKPASRKRNSSLDA